METRYVLLGLVLLGLAGCSSLDRDASRGSFLGGSAETSPPVTSGEPRRGVAPADGTLGNQTSSGSTYREGNAPSGCTPVAPCGPGLSSEKR